MTIYAISDLHLSFNKPVDLYGIRLEQDVDKPMDIFGWKRHFDRVRDHWLETVKQEDTVLIPGDISWALRLDQATYDFNWIGQLPGKKVLSPGNHCYYAQSKKKVRQHLPEGMTWIDADYTLVEGFAVAATRGWNLPGDKGWNEAEDRKIYERQAGRLRLALEAAAKEHPDKERLVMLHYPPVTSRVKESAFMDLLHEFQVKTCVYGHLHGRSHHEAVEGVIQGVELQLVSCDYLDFRPIAVRLNHTPS
ncbi:metallophosphoesterase [Desmospora profundinema]|uniref:Phosphohydrolase n=1 Tax=Desmospora profundinema TaxID=1571184 RepID=A0ABU1ILL7_9BACL|nr:metallophosphoesterase [Desmospora profundinema]MDR6224680.1 putative phosphohydrolase [Desmospora profundinema]